MRTTLDLKDDLVGALMERFAGASKTEAFEVVLEDYLQRDAVKRLESLAGNVEIDDVSYLRKIDRTS